MGIRGFAIGRRNRPDNFNQVHALTGLITVLDDTLGNGILGELGISGVSFALGSGTQISGLYPQLVQSLAERSVLLAIASKNDVAFGEQAMGRTGLLLRRSIFSCRISLGTDFDGAHFKSLEY